MSETATSDKIATALKTNLGITDPESRILIPILASGNMTAGAISILTAEKVQAVEKSLESLMHKGLIRRMAGVVPIYSAVPPYLMMGPDLTAVVGEAKSLAEDSKAAFKSRDEKQAEVVEAMTSARRGVSAELATTLDEYESAVIEVEQTNAVGAIQSASEALTGFCETAASVLTDRTTSLSDDIGAQLAGVQADLDRTRNEIQTEVKAIIKEFDQVVRSELDSSSQSITDFGKRTKGMVQKAKSSVKNTLANNLQAIQQATEGLTGGIESASSDTVRNAASQLTALLEELTRMLDQFNAELDQTSAEAEASLGAVMLSSGEAANSMAKSAREKIDSALQVTTSTGADLDSWMQESDSIIQSASEQVVTQLGQVGSMHASSLEEVKSTLSAHLGKRETMLSQAVGSLSDLSSGMQGQLDSLAGESKSSMLKLLQTQLSASRDRVDSMASSLGTVIEKWAGDTGRSIEKRMAQAGKEVGAGLDSEAGKFASLTGELTNRLDLAFDSVLAATVDSNKEVVSGTKKFAREFETGVGSKLGEIVSNFTSSADAHIQESTGLYQGLRSTLDSRLAQSVSSLSSHAERMQKDIDVAIEDQVARIDRHIEGIRKDFRARLDEIAKENAGLAESLGSVFAGLLSGQGLETRDLIGSAHTQFRNALKGEIASLQEDSAKLQKDYSSEIETRVRKVTASHETMRKALEDLVTQRRSALSRSMAELLNRIETTFTDTEQGLGGIKNGIVKEMGADLAQASTDFSASMATLRDDSGSRMTVASGSVTESLAKTTSGLKATIDEYALGEKDAQQRLLADTTKKLDTLSSKLAKDLLARTESFKAEMNALRKESTKMQTAVDSGLATLLDSHKSEAELAVNEASTSVRSMFSDTSSNLASVLARLNQTIAEMQQGLANAAEDAETSLVQQSEASIDQFQRAAIALLGQVQASFRTRAADLGAACSASVDQSIETLSGLPTSLLDIIQGTTNETVTQIAANNSEAIDGLAEEFSGSEGASKSITDELNLSLDRFRGVVTKSMASLFEKTKQSLAAANEHASEYLQSAGIGVTSQLTDVPSSLMETLRNEVATSSAYVNAVAERLRADITESMGRARQVRTDALARFDSETENALQHWSEEQQGRNYEFQQREEAVMNGLESVVSRTMMAIDAVRTAGELLVKAPPESTWYLTGSDEVHAHIMDMAQRAQESIVIATVNARSLDIKRLAKMADPIRKVIIVPESEEQQPALRELLGVGWRVWKTTSPMTLAVADDKEILIGGATETRQPLVLVSNDKTYLKLFHDILGPVLVIRPRPLPRPVTQPDGV